MTQTRKRMLGTCGLSWLLCLVGLVAGASVAAAEASLLPLQGFLSDSDGVPIDGEHRLTFSVYDAETDGTALFVDDLNVPVSEGLFVVYLGDDASNPFDGAWLGQYGSLWVEVVIDGSEILTPRVRLASVPHADHCGIAEMAETAEAAETAADAAHAKSADTATSAMSATEATHAKSADTATSAMKATAAGHADTADMATLAARATKADSATTAGTAASASNADKLGGVAASGYARTTHVHNNYATTSYVDGNYATTSYVDSNYAKKSHGHDWNELVVPANFCVMAETCPTGFEDKGRAGYLLENGKPCPYTATAGSGFGSGYHWCHPTLCCKP